MTVFPKTLAGDTSAQEREETPPEIAAVQQMPYGLAGFSRFVGLLRLENGSPMKLAPFQRFLLSLYFAGVVELIIIMPKKNGKTTLMAALALYHLLMIPAAECVISACSEKQAAILHNQARRLVMQSSLDRRPILGRDRRERVEYEGTFDVRPGIHEIRFELGRIRVLPADVRTVQGVIPTLALVDEYQHYTSSDVYAVLRDGLTPRAGQMIAITNPGSDVTSPLGILRSRMLETTPEIDGRRRLYRSKDGTTVLVEWGLLDEDNPENLRLVKQANPAPWQTLSALRRRRDSPSMTLWEWRRMGAGMWTQGETTPLISQKDWEALKVDVGGISPGDEVYVGVRIGAEIGIGLASLRGEGVAVKMIRMPNPVGSRVPLRLVEAKLRELGQTYDVVSVVYPGDPFARSAELLEEEGVPMLDVPHSVKKLVQATSTFWRLVSGRLLSHDGDPELRRQVLSADFKETQQGWRIDPSADTAGLVAVMMAVHEATDMEDLDLRVVGPSGAG